MDHRIKKAIAVGTALGAVSVLHATAPASAGPGTSQEIRTALNFPVTISALSLRECDKDGNCTDTPLTPGATIDKLELLLSYSYSPTRVDEAPDVNTLTGKLITTDACNGHLGIRIDVTGATVTGSSTQVHVGGHNGSFPGETRQVTEGVFVQRCLPTG